MMLGSRPAFRLYARRPYVRFSYLDGILTPCTCTHGERHFLVCRYNHPGGCLFDFADRHTPLGHAFSERQGRGAVFGQGGQQVGGVPCDSHAVFAVVVATGRALLNLTGGVTDDGAHLLGSMNGWRKEDTNSTVCPLCMCCFDR